MEREWNHLRACMRETVENRDTRELCSLINEKFVIFDNI